MSWLDDLFTVQPPTDQYVTPGINPDNPVPDVFDFSPDTSLGSEARTQEELGQGIVQEALGRQIILDTQQGLAQEELGRGIVQETLGQSILDSLLRGPDNTDPWLRGIDGSLSGVTKVMSKVGLLGKTDPTPTPGGVPLGVGTQPIFGPNRGNVYNVNPSNSTRDGRPGVLGGSVQRVASITGEFGGLDFLYASLALVTAYAAFRVVRAL